MPRLPFRMFLGGAAIVAMWRLVGSSDYLGLGVPTILRAFHDPRLPAYAFAAKIAFTAVTLGCGFLGGEVTPLFFIGATLGNVLGPSAGDAIELARRSVWRRSSGRPRTRRSRSPSWWWSSSVARSSRTWSS